MRFNLEHKRCCPSELRPGEAKRVPKNPLHPAAGFYVGCPRCGRPQVVTTRAVDPNLGQVVTEEGARGEIVSLGPGYTCDRCGVVFVVERGEVVIRG